MKKQLMAGMMAASMALSLAACGGKTDTPPADTNDGSTAGQTGGKLGGYSAPAALPLPAPQLPLPAMNR